MTGPQANQIYDLWVDRCREQLERGATGNALAAWMQAEGVSAAAAAEILRLAQAELATDAKQQGSDNNAPTAPAPTASAEPGTTEAHISPSVNPVESPRPDREAAAAPPPDVQTERARAHENAAAAFARAFNKSARRSRGDTSPASPIAGSSSAQAAHETQRPAQPSPRDTPAHRTPPPPDMLGQASGTPPSTPTVTAPPALQDPTEPPQFPATQTSAEPLPEPGRAAPDADPKAQGEDHPAAQELKVNAPEDNGMPGYVLAGETPGIAVPEPAAAGEVDVGSPHSGSNPADSMPLEEGGPPHVMAPNEIQPGEQRGDQSPDLNAIEPVTVDVAHQDDFDGGGSESPTPAVARTKDASPGAIAGAPAPGSVTADASALHEPVQSREPPDEPTSPVAGSHAAEPDPLTGKGGGPTDEVLPDDPELGNRRADEDATATVGESVAGPDEIFGAASVESAKRRSFGRRNTAPPELADDHEHGSPTTPNDGMHISPAEESTAEPAESELRHLLDDADRAADPEPHLPSRLANPKTEQELANAAKLLGISFRDDPKRPRAELQLEEDDETVKAARQLGIRFREEPKSSEVPDLDDPMAKAALELGINFRDIDRSSSDQKSTLRRYWPIIVVLALAAIAMPITVAILMFMGET